MAPAVVFPNCIANMGTGAVHPGRIQVLKPGVALSSATSKPGPVVYWMFRDQRSRDNWALFHAVHLANRSSAPVAVAFNLFHRFLGAHARQLGFMLRGLRSLSVRLRALGIPFFLLRGEAVDTIPCLLRDCGASALVTDFSPLRSVRAWKAEICERVGPEVAVHQVDAHNVVPVWAASEKLEYSAKTIRPKIHRLLPEYLDNIPDLPKTATPWTAGDPPEIDWEGLIADVLREGEEVPEIEWCEPGEDEAMEVLLGNKEGFLTRRLRNYQSDRNNPLKPSGLSGLSPYLHFGQISAQRCAWEARVLKKSHPQVNSLNLSLLVLSSLFLLFFFFCWLFLSILQYVGNLLAISVSLLFG